VAGEKGGGGEGPLIWWGYHWATTCRIQQKGNTGVPGKRNRHCKPQNEKFSAGNGHQVMHVAVAVEYTLELWFLCHMAGRKVAAGESAVAQDTLINRLLDEAVATR